MAGDGLRWGGQHLLSHARARPTYLECIEEESMGVVAGLLKERFTVSAFDVEACRARIGASVPAISSCRGDGRRIMGGSGRRTEVGREA